MNYEIGKVKTIKNSPDHEFRVLTFNNKKRIVCHTVKPTVQLMAYKHCIASSSKLDVNQYLVKMPYQNFFYPLKKNLHGKTKVALSEAKLLLSSKSPFETENEELYPSFIPNFNFDFHYYFCIIQALKNYPSFLSNNNDYNSIKGRLYSYFGTSSVCFGYSDFPREQLTNLNEIPKLALNYYDKIYSSVFNLDFSPYHYTLNDNRPLKTKNHISSFFGFDPEKYDPSKLSIKSLGYSKKIGPITMQNFLGISRFQI